MPKPRLLPCTSAPGSRSGVSAEVALGLDLQPRCWPCGVMGQTRRPRGALWQTWVEKPLRSRVSPAFFDCPLLPGLGSLIHSFARSLTPLGGGCCGKQGGLTFLLLPLAPWSCTCPSLCSPCGGEPGRPCGSGERGGGRGRCQWAAGIRVKTGDCPASPKRSGGGRQWARVRSIASVLSLVPPKPHLHPIFAVGNYCRLLPGPPYGPRRKLTSL